MAVYDQGPAPFSGAARAGALVNYAGAAISCALVIGVGVWGYKLVVRDVTGIPVVRAMAGEMRVLPDNPGGEVTLHTGLSVNEVAAIGVAAAPEDTVALAPPTSGLSDEDLEAQPMAEAAEMMAVVDPLGHTEVAMPVALNAAQLVDAPLSTDDILALADQIAAGAAPLQDLSEAVDTAPELAVAAPAAEETPAPAAVAPAAGVVTVSLRPTARPTPQTAVSDDSAVEAALAAALAPAQPDALVTTADFTAGTNLVQLGAFPSPDVADVEWRRLNERFGEVLVGKSRVIQAATSGGKTFYRLRAEGFVELSDARRFCAMMVAENVDCIPVVVR